MMSLMNYPICKKRKKLKLLSLFLLVVVSGIRVMDVTTIQAEAKGGTGLLQAGSTVNVWGAEDKVSLRRISDGFRITLSGNDMDTYYQYSAINLNFSSLGSFSQKGGFSCYVNNTGSQEAYLNFALNDVNQNKLSLKEDSVILAGRDRVLTMENGWIILEPGFSGTLLIPFAQCEAMDMQGEETDSFSYRACYGMTVMTLVTQNVENSFELISVEAAPAKDIPDLSESDAVTLSGAAQIKLPQLGEYWEQYELTGDNAKNYEFVETYYGDYVHMDKDGTLHVLSGCQPSKIMICLRNKESNLMIKKEVTLYEDWRATSEVYTFYSPTEVGKTTYTMEFLNKPVYLIVARFACVLIVVAGLLAYAIGRYKKRRDLNKLQKGEI